MTMDEKNYGEAIRVTDHRAGYGDQLQRATQGYGSEGANNALKRIPAAPDALERLDKSVAAIYNELDLLTTRLQPILGHPLPQAVGAGQKESPENLPSVAGRIRTCEHAMQQIRGRLSDLLQRLEV
jgi:hypothetical protein